MKQALLSQILSDSKVPIGQLSTQSEFSNSKGSMHDVHFEASSHVAQFASQSRFEKLLYLCK